MVKPTRTTTSADEHAWNPWLSALLSPDVDLGIQQIGRLITTSMRIPHRVQSVHVMHYLIDGGIRGEADRTPLQVAPGGMLWIPPGTQHWIEADKPGRRNDYVFIRFVPNRNGQPIPHPPSNAMVIDGLSSLQANILSLHDEWRGTLPGRNCRIRCWLALILSSWWRASLRLGREYDSRLIRRLVTLLREDTKRRWRPSDLAIELRISEHLFHTTVVDAFGLPPRQWLVQDRIQRSAQELLECHDPIGVVARRYGYDDIFLFSRQFTKIMNVSPRRWRRQAWAT